MGICTYLVEQILKPILWVLQHTLHARCRPLTTWSEIGILTPSPSPHPSVWYVAVLNTSIYITSHIDRGESFALFLGHNLRRLRKVTFPAFTQSLQLLAVPHCPADPLRGLLAMVLLIFLHLGMAPLPLHSEGVLSLGIEFPTVNTLRISVLGHTAVTTSVFVLLSESPPVFSFFLMFDSDVSRYVFLWVYIGWDEFNYLYL